MERYIVVLTAYLIAGGFACMGIEVMPQARGLMLMLAGSFGALAICLHLIANRCRHQDIIAAEQEERILALVAELVAEQERKPDTDRIISTN